MKKIIDLLILVCLGLVPLIWFRSEGFIISGDMLPPISWEGFLNRFFCWDERLGGGHESMLHFSVLFFYSVEALLTTLLPSIVMAQKAEFVFWFFLSGVGIYYLLSVLLQGEGRYWGRWVGVLFYLFNLYLEPVWQGMNIANLSCYVFVPILLGLTIEALEKRRSFGFCVVAFSLITFFAAPIGSNPPMLLASIIPFVIYALLFFFKNRVWKEGKALARFIGFFVLVGIFSFLINLFWIIPFVLQVFVNTAQTSLEFTPGSALDWLKGLSRNTSLVNVAKMQGAWVWYEGFGEPYIPYAQIFQKNPFFVLMGYFLPVLVAIGFVVSRQKLTGLLLGALALLGVVLGTGLHPPFGKLYAWMVENVPFFYIVRSPWYKFTLLTCIGYAGLLAFLGQRLARVQIGFKRIGAVIALTVLLAYNVVYAFPVSTGRLFMTPSEREFMTHNYMAMPDYVEQTLDYLQSKDQSFRVLDASSKKLQEYDWGNFGFNHALSSFTLIPVFYASMINSPSLYPSDQMVQMLHEAVKQKNRSQYVQLLKRFGISYLIYPYDMHWYEMKDVEKASEFQEFLETCPDLIFEKRFGQWKLYRVQGAESTPLSIQPEPYFVMGDWKILPSLLNTPELQKENFVFIDSLEKVFKEFEIDSLKLLLVNMDWDQWVAAESAPDYGLGGMNRQKQEIPLNASGLVQIWLQASGDDLLQLSNIQLNQKPIFLNKENILPGKVLQWAQIYKGTLSEATLYIRNATKEGEIDQVLVIPESVFNEKRQTIDRLLKENKINPSWLKTVQKGTKEFSFSFPAESSFSWAVADQTLLQKEESILWTGDISIESPYSLEIVPKHKGVTFFRAAEGWVFKFLDEVQKGEPSVVISVDTLVNLSEYDQIYFDYKLFDLLSCSAQIRFVFEDQTSSPKELVLPAATRISLLKELKREYPLIEEPKLVHIDFELNHSFEHRKGFRRYPHKEAVFREIKVGKITEDPLVRSELNQKEKELIWTLPRAIRQSNLWIGEGVLAKSSNILNSEKKNPTSYKVKLPPSVEGMLVFNQGYHPLWQAFSKEGKEMLHFKLNGWENGYFLKGADKMVSLEFQPQKKVYLGYLLSGLSAALLLFVLIGLLRRKK